jgi:peptidyl-Asp metalloendopeptidase
MTKLRFLAMGCQGCSLLAGAGLLLLSGFHATATAQAQAGLTPDQQSIAESLVKSSGGQKVHFSVVPAEPIGAEVKLPFRGGTVTLVGKTSTRRSDGSISWRGEVAETGEPAALMVWNNAPLTGYFAYDGTIFTIENAGGGVNIFAEMDPSKLPADHPSPASSRDNLLISSQLAIRRQALSEPKVAPFADAERQALEAKKITIDLMMLYTGNVAKRYVRDPDDLLELAVEQTDEILAKSGLGNITLRLVHSQLIDYDGSKDDQFTHLYTMVDGLEQFKDVRKLRNEKRADIVGLVIDNPNGCGLATRIGPDSDEAFFVVHHACATVSMSIAHEIGHILGIRHDRHVDANDTPFAYGHGHVNGEKWRDLMSYNGGCGGCPRIAHFSNPRVMYKGEPTGTAAADSARVILQLAERVANFR